MFLDDTALHIQRLRSKNKLTDEGIIATRRQKPLDFLARMTAQSLAAERCLMFVHDPNHEKLWLKAGTDTRERTVELPLAHSVAGRVVESGQPMIANALTRKDSADGELEEATILNAESLVCVPVHSTDRRSDIAGVIEVVNKKDHGNFDETDRAFLEEVSEHCEKLVDSTFLEQDVFGYSKRIAEIARQTCVAGSMTIFAVLLAVFLLMGAYTILPSLFR